MLSGYVPVRYCDPVKVSLLNPDGDAFNMAAGMSHANLQTGHIKYSTQEPLPQDRRGHAVLEHREEEVNTLSPMG